MEQISLVSSRVQMTEEGYLPETAHTFAVSKNGCTEGWQS